MPSKGVDCFTWIALKDWKVVYDVPKGALTHDGYRVFERGHLEVDKDHISGLLNFTGPFSFTVTDGKNNVVLTKKNEINSVTGALDGGDMTSIPHMQSLVRDDCVVTFGFYDAGHGIAGLPKSHECWVTVTPNWSAWMNEVAPSGSPQASKRFGTFVLPSAHDVGMNTMQTCEALLNNATDITPIVGEIGSALHLDDLIAKGNIPKIITALAITQKDTVRTLLQTGARYFEFRPAHMSTLFKGVDHLPDKLYFQHLLIPGLAFDDFLDQVVQFLVDFPSELVTVQIRFDGVASTCAHATPQEIDQYVAAALKTKSDSVVRAGFPDISETIDKLRAQKKRLIILTDAQQFSTYSDKANATLNGKSIEATFPAFISSAAAQAAHNELFLWQCQATATDIKDVTIYTVVASTSASSPLLCTKPVCDQVTLPWLQKNAGAMPDTTLQAIMNDFFDGATADIAIELSRNYLNRQ